MIGTLIGGEVRERVLLLQGQIYKWQKRGLCFSSPNSSELEWIVIKEKGNGVCSQMILL